MAVKNGGKIENKKANTGASTMIRWKFTILRCSLINLSTNYQKNEKSLLQVHSYLSSSILIKVFRRLCTIDFPSHRRLTDIHTDKQFSFNYIDKGFIHHQILAHIVSLAKFFTLLFNIIVKLCIT